MTIQLTEQQQQVLAEEGDHPATVVDPRTNRTYVLIPANEYESIKEILEEERRQKAIHTSALRNAVRCMDEEP